MNQTKTSILFGRACPWPQFRPINDTVRGGASTSSFTTDPKNVATFQGNLDITALGGAGFASQCTTFCPVLKFSRATSTGLAITLLAPSALDAEKSLPTSFVLALKSEIPQDRPDGRRESVMSYEFTWDVASLPAGKGGEIQVEAAWEDFIPMFRGRQPSNPEPLNTAAIHELSFMCRSDFGKQYGAFTVQIVDLRLINRSLSSTNPSLFLAKFREWFLRLYNYFTSLGRGNNGIRLP